MDDKELDNSGKRKILAMPEAGNALTASKFASRIWGDGDECPTMNEYAEAIIEHKKRLKDGDLSTLEGMLVSQAVTLDAMFTSMAKSGIYNLTSGSEYFNAGRELLRLGLKAQNQSRATLQALIELKQPRQITIANQANIAGQQIVNNGDSAAGKNHGEKQNNQNGLLGEVVHGQVEPQRMDTRTAQTASRSNPKLAAVA